MKDNKKEVRWEYWMKKQCPILADHMSGFCAGSQLYNLERKDTKSAKEALLIAMAQELYEGGRMFTISGRDTEEHHVFEAAKQLAEEYYGITYTETEPVVNYNSGSLVKVGVITITFDPHDHVHDYVCHDLECPRCADGRRDPDNYPF